MASKGTDLDYYNSNMPDNRATNGGQCVPKEIPYDPPKGPEGIMRKGVGLGGTNHGTCGTQGKH